MERFLTNEQVIELKAHHRRERDRRVADRIKAVILANNGWTYKRIAEALMLDEETISVQVKEYQTKEKLKPGNGGSSSKLSREEVEELLKHLEENTYDKALRIRAYVKEKYNVEYSVNGMVRWLRDNGFSYKKPKGIPAKADVEKQKAFIAKYEELMNKAPYDEPIVFTDAVHPTQATKISYGWIKAGADKLIKTTASRTRVNLYGAINLEDMKVITSTYETINSASVIDFYKQLKKKYPNAPNIHVILDQAGYHTSEEMRKYAASNNIILHYLPPYSPNLNPIERLWKVMNENCRNNVFFSSPKEFRAAIRNFFEKTWDTIASSMVDRINDNFQLLKPTS